MLFLGLSQFPAAIIACLLSYPLTCPSLTFLVGILFYTCYQLGSYFRDNSIPDGGNHGKTRSDVFVHQCLFCEVPDTENVIFWSLSCFKIIGGTFNTKQRNQAGVLQWTVVFAEVKVIVYRYTQCHIQKRASRVSNLRDGYNKCKYFFLTRKHIRQQKIKENPRCCLLILIAEPRISYRSKVGHVTEGTAA